MGTYSRHVSKELPEQVFAYMNQSGVRVYDLAASVKSMNTRERRENKRYYSTRADPRVFVADVVWREITDEL